MFKDLMIDFDVHVVRNELNFFFGQTSSSGKQFQNAYVPTHSRKYLFIYFFFYVELSNSNMSSTHDYTLRARSSRSYKPQPALFRGLPRIHAMFLSGERLFYCFLCALPLSDYNAVDARYYATTNGVLLTTSKYAINSCPLTALIILLETNDQPQRGIIIHHL